MGLGVGVGLAVRAEDRGRHGVESGERRVKEEFEYTVGVYNTHIHILYQNHILLLGN